MTPRTTRLLAGLALLAACGETPTAVDRPAADRPLPVLAASYDLSKYDLTNTLSVGGVFAESSYMACIASLQAQGLPYKQILDECATQLTWQGEQGWGGDGKGFTLPSGGKTALDPGAVSGSCGSVDPSLSKGLNWQGTTTLNPFDGKTVDDWGGFSYGKSTACDSWGCFQGMTKAEAEAEKQRLIDEAYDAEEAFRQAADAYLNDPNNAQKKDEMEHRRRQMEEAQQKAKQDPNKKPIKTQEPAAGTAVAGDANGADDGSTAVANTAGEISTCIQVLQAARELLAECHRTGWKSTECQQLHAKMNGCPDPTLIYVDPESGYACAPPVDPQLVIDAWTKMCERNVTPGPDGGSPCHKPNPSESGRILHGDETEICSSQIAYVDPEQAGCFVPLEVDDFGRPDLNGLIVWGQGVFGGPIVVLPQIGPSPFPPKS